MEMQEKFVFAKEKPLYDAIPLIIFDKGERTNFKVKGENLKYNVSNPVCMTFRLVFFWILWTALIIAMIITIFAHFWFTARNSYYFKTHENVNITNR